MDVLWDLGNKFKDGETRMSWQIKLEEEMNGIEVEIPRSAFSIFDKLDEEE